jgi:hypothetical protein
MDAGRYIVEDEPALGAVLDGFLARLGTDLAAQPWSGHVALLVLGGGYGRGEGGVFRAGEGAPAALYNDLEFYLLLRAGAPEAAAAEWVARWERDGSAELGIDVEFKRAAAAGFLAGEPSLFLLDLLQGHRVVWGDAGLLAAAPARLRDPAAVPAEEATRLLFNRGSGLLFSRWRLEEDPEDAAGFVERNLAKCRLALADAVLAAAGRHDGSCRERARRLATGGFPVPAGFDELVRWHAEGVAFKLRPRHRRPGGAVLRAELARVAARWDEVFRWTEGRRLGAAFPTAAAYAAHPGRIFPCSARGRNVLLHLRDRLRRGGALPGWGDYPRAALQRALAAALDPAAAGEAAAARLLGVPASAWRAAYRRWWAHYN